MRVDFLSGTWEAAGKWYNIPEVIIKENSSQSRILCPRKISSGVKQN
jgi:hypothetical protein